MANGNLRLSLSFNHTYLVMNLSVITKQISRTPRASAIVALLMLMVSAQTLSLLHAEVHLFHDSDELCVAFHNVDKQPALPGSLAYAREHRGYSSTTPRIQQHTHSVQALAFHARAPPYRRPQTIS